ncbi:MAG: sodium-dependent bicarbonate transport family permease [Alphaproteobacteria bacterium]|nr:sodium-dependent bicarbonate transport family permease [Alphaproteobacteria bacterium]
MDIIFEIASTMLAQLQKPTLAFLIGGMLLAALGSKLEVPAPVYKFVVMLLLLKVGLGAGISVREADFLELALPAFFAAFAGVIIVVAGGRILSGWPGVSHMDGYATAGLFGAVSASTLAAGMAMLDDGGIAYEGFIGALYPFMDIAALVTAIVLAKTAEQRRLANVVHGDGTAAMTIGSGVGSGGDGVAPLAINKDLLKQILVDTFRSPAISALALGLAIGVFAKPQSVYDSFYEPLFRGLLSILMLVMGMEAWSRLSELAKVAHAYLLYGLISPVVHGFVGFGFGLLAHELTGFSAGGVVLLSIMAASSSDISGPPTMRAALPKANPSAYIGTSTGLGTPVAIFSIPVFMALADAFIGF